MSRDWLEAAEAKVVVGKTFEAVDRVEIKAAFVGRVVGSIEAMAAEVVPVPTAMHSPKRLKSSTNAFDSGHS